MSAPAIDAPPSAGGEREMRVVSTIGEVRAAVAAVKAGGGTVGFVPTMGYLHEGHLQLVDRARESAGWVMMSIFVNPLQFGPTEDLSRYPRDLERDLALAKARGVDLVFAPSVEEMYPHGEPRVFVVPDEEIAGRLCGASRPGHFRGVLTVVAKLFGIAQPDVAVFGQKDWQQATLIRRMVEDLEMPVRVDVAPIVREADGLAMSSRNVYLTGDERERALALSRSLRRARELFEAGESDAAVLKAALLGGMTVPGVVCAVAARVGRTRLIDNAILP